MLGDADAQHGRIIAIGKGAVLMWLVNAWGAKQRFKKL